MAKTRRREVDGQVHHPPKSVEQQSEDSFPASDPPSFSGGNVIGAPQERETHAGNTDKRPNADKDRKKES
jgi:hypothetical protein